MHVKSHRSPTHKALHAFSIRPMDFESIIPCNYSSKWTPNFPICIPTSKEAALEAMSAIWSEVVMYSDMSGLNGQIGEAMVLYRCGTEQAH